MKKISLLLITILAIFFRFNNLNWDQNFHLHPDERFLTMVTQSMKIPENVEEYFNQKKSMLNPYNIGFNFYVYGIFPLVLTKYLAVSLRMDDYNQINILGRFLSALADFLNVILVYKTTRLLTKSLKKVSYFKLKFIPLLSAFFYAISVYPIQSAHFFTTDTFLNFFMFASFYFILKIIESRFFILNLFLSSFFFALALASKISALYILPLNLIILFLIKTVFDKESFFKRQSFFKVFLINLLKKIFFLFVYLMFCYFFIRIFNPYYFEYSSFFNPNINKSFFESIKTLVLLSNDNVWYPPSVQWIEKPFHGLLMTTFLAGLGPMNFIICFIGLFYFLISFLINLKLKIKNYYLIIFLIVLWVVVYFVYQSFQFVKSIRYTIYLYPFFAIFGGFGISFIFYWLCFINKKNSFFCYFMRYILYFILLIWPLLFSSIYFFPHTRVEASEWIYKNLKNNTIILGEHWDDVLPLPIEKNLGKFFQVEILPVFDPDNNEKWQKMKELLQKADYYVLSSNRGWGSISTVPYRYPLMSMYYKALLNEDCEKQKKLVGVCYKKIKTFQPYYYKFIKYPDDWIEETFTVYDHPTVLIYKKI